MTGAGYRDEDMQFRRVAGPPLYQHTAEGPVRYVVVANEDGVLGYLWVSDAADAAGYVARRSGGDVAMNSGGYWLRKLRPGKAEGLPPSQALATLPVDSGSPMTGRIVTGSEGTAPSLAVLKELAG
jgi:hypothetical protein